MQALNIDRACRLDDGYASAAYAGSLSGCAAGGLPARRWHIDQTSASCNDLHLADAGGTLTGRPRAGTCYLTATVSDASNLTQHKQWRFQIAVAETPVAITLPDHQLPRAIAGEAYGRARVSVDGGFGRARVEAVNLPEGLKIRGQRISGKPKDADDVEVTFRAPDRHGHTASAQAELLVSAPRMPYDWPAGVQKKLDDLNRIGEKRDKPKTVAARLNDAAQALEDDMRRRRLCFDDTPADAELVKAARRRLVEAGEAATRVRGWGDGKIAAALERLIAALEQRVYLAEFSGREQCFATWSGACFDRWGVGLHATLEWRPPDWHWGLDEPNAGALEIDGKGETRRGGWWTLRPYKPGWAEGEGRFEYDPEERTAVFRGMFTIPADRPVEMRCNLKLVRWKEPESR